MVKKNVFCDICEKDFVITGYKADMVGDGVGSDKDKIKWFCPNNDNHFKISRDKEFDKIPLGTKQKFMDLIKEGKTIGEAKTEVGVSTEIGAEILVRQINNIKVLSYKVKE